MIAVLIKLLSSILVFYVCFLILKRFGAAKTKQPSGQDRESADYDKDEWERIKKDLK